MFSKMASCFRIISNKFCCSNYLKVANNRKPTASLLTSNTRNYCRLLNTNFSPANTSFSVLRTTYSENYLNSSAKNRGYIYDEIIRQNRYEHNISMFAAIPATDGYQFLVSACNDGKVSKKTKCEPELKGRPSEEQLQKVFDELSKSLPLIFVRGINTNYYHPNIILENNIKGTRAVGLNSYVYKVALLRMLGHIKFAYVKLEILKITKHPEDGTIKCRWRIVGVPGITVALQIWKFLPWKIKKQVELAPTWHDGFSIYYVGSEGTIVKHIIDKMQPDDNRIEIDSNPKSSVTPKVALFLGLLSPLEGEEFMDIFH